ncbi:MAG TPA: hypothetical protein VGV69_09690, partial [Solirubrobacterales bacterium]|nr:hypothetical protein [Solirubrobacterales bacterium]
VSAVHQKLSERGISHAVGGALAVGYYGEPRSTVDIDVNVFLPADRWSDLRNPLAALDIALQVEERDPRRTDEVRLEWGSSFLHLFFSCDSLHEQMRRDIRCVPFNDGTIPIVAPEHLVVRKAMLDRTKDWLDIEQILVATSPLDLEEIEMWLGRLAGEGDPRMTKLAEVRDALSLV